MDNAQASLSCAFTGHRPTRFAFKDDETHTSCVELKQVIKRQIEHLYQCGVRRFYTGCALGVDMWAGETVLSLAEQCPHIELYSVVPFRGQETKWKPEQQKRYHDLLKRSNGVFVLNEGFTKDCYLERNRFLVDQSDVLLAVYDEGAKKRSGTGYTVNYAKKGGKPILLIHPDTFQIHHSPFTPLFHPQKKNH